MLGERCDQCMGVRCDQCMGVRCDQCWVRGVISVWV